MFMPDTAERSTSSDVVPVEDSVAVHRDPSPRRLELLLAAVALLLSTGAVLSLWAPAGDVLAGGESSVNRAIWALLYLASASLLLATGTLRPALRRVPWTLWLLLLVAAASPVWSADPVGSATRLAALAGSTVIGLYIGARFGSLDFLRVNGWAIVLAIAASFAVGIAAPSLAVTQDVRGDMWRGAFPHKNTLGIMMAWGVAVSLLLAVHGRAWRRIGWLGVGAAALLLLAMSGSRTGVVVLVAASLACWGGLWLARAPRVLAIATGTIALAVAGATTFLVATNFVELTTALGRDPTLTGRTEIWRAVIDSIAQRPWLGYGYEAFWGGIDSPARAVWAQHGVGFGVTEFRAMSAHNGWLNVWLQLGVGAVALLAASLAIAIGRSMRQLRAHRTAATAAPLLFLVYLLIFSTVEGAMINANGFFWIMLVAIIAHVPTRSELDERRAT
jgi:exopolysaccharide production protein ExoQ